MLLLALLASATAVDDRAGVEPVPVTVVVAPAYPGERLPDSELARLRGGIRLPSGTDVNIAVQSETSVDGLLLLRSIYRLDGGGRQLQLFAPTGDQRVETRPATGAASGTGAGGMAVIFDRTTGVLLVPTVGGVAGPAVNVTRGESRGMAMADGLDPLAIAPGQTIDTAGGTLKLAGDNGTLRAQLAGMDIDVSHFFGQSYGTLISNSGSDRTIDTVTSISLDVGNMTAETLASAMLRVESIALEAARGLIR